MLNKIVALLFLLLGIHSFSQSTSTSPYSYYGIGELKGMDNGLYSGIGNVTTSYFDSTALNFYNPSSYCYLGQGQPMFSVGLSSRLSNYSQDTNKVFNKSIVLNNISFGLSYGKYLGFAIGIKPYSRRGYDFYETQKVGDFTLKHSYKGSGSNNEVFFGMATKVLDFERVKMSVGGNIGYVFGDVTNTRISNLIGADSNAGGVSEKITYLKAVHYQLGTNFEYHISDFKSIRLSAVYDPAQKFYGAEVENLYYATLVNNPLSYFLQTSTGRLTGHYTTQSTLSLGLNYVWKFSDLKPSKNTSRNSEIQIHANYTTEDWTKANANFGGNEVMFKWNAVTQINAGIQYIPEVKNAEKTVHADFFEIIKYRVGFYQYNLPFTVKNQTILDRGYTLGLGIPLTAQKSLSSINLGFSYGNRGANDVTAVKEQYYNINLSLLFSPANFERWFVKRKLD